MLNEEARTYFIDCNERIISVAKDENIYNYKTQQVEDVFMRRTFEANELAIKALERQSCEDAISRQEMLGGLANIAKAKARSDAQKALMGRIMFFTEHLPPVNETAWIVPIILIDKKGEEHDGLMDMRRMLIYLHNIPAETAISLGYTWKLAEGREEE